MCVCLTEPPLPRPSGGGSVRQTGCLMVSPASVLGRRKIMSALDRSAPWDRSLMVGGCVKGTGRMREQIFSLVAAGLARQGFTIERRDDTRGNDHNPNGPRPAPRGSVARVLSTRDGAWPDRREGAAQFLRIDSYSRIRLTDGCQCRAQGSLRGRIAPPQRWASSRRCLTCHPRGASPILQMGPATVATRSICPSSRQGRLPLARKLY